MKKLLIICCSLMIAVAASAQRGHGHIRPSMGYYPRVGVAMSFSPFYNPYYSPFYPYGVYPTYVLPHRPSALELRIEDIKNDYKEKIWAVKHDDGLTRKQRRQEVRRLKHERD